MPTYINLGWMMDAFIWVLHQHTKKSVTEREERPIEPPDEHSVVEAAEILQAFRMQLYAEKARAYAEREPEPDYKPCRDRFLNDQMKVRKWTVARRNFYSSLISTYVPWERAGGPSEKIKEEIERLRPGFELFTQFWARRAARQLEMEL